jgi:hypothetical protein
MQHLIIKGLLLFVICVTTAKLQHNVLPFPCKKTGRQVKQDAASAKSPAVVSTEWMCIAFHAP